MWVDWSGECTDACAGVNAQVGFLVRIEGQRLTADLEECYPDYEFAFEAEDEGVRGMYYRCERTRELQAEFGDMLHRILDLEAGHTPHAHTCCHSICEMAPSIIQIQTLCIQC